MTTKEISPFIPRARHLIPALLISLALIQVLDIHSTLSADNNHAEANRTINWLSQWLGFANAVYVMKAISVLALLILYKIWRLSNGSHDREFIICLTLSSVVYGFIVANNYLS